MTHETTLVARRREVALHALAGESVRYEMMIDYREITVTLTSSSYPAMEVARYVCLATAQEHSATWTDDDEHTRESRSILSPLGGRYYATWVRFDVPPDVDLLAALTHDLEYCGVMPADDDVDPDA